MVLKGIHALIIKALYRLVGNNSALVKLHFHQNIMSHFCIIPPDKITLQPN